MTKKMKIILLAELLVLIAVSGVLFLRHSGGSYEIPVSMSEWSVNGEFFGQDQWRIEPDEETDENPEAGESSVTMIESPGIHLPKGTYTLDLWYQCDVTQSAVPYAKNKQDRLIRADEFYLSSKQNHLTYMFSADEDIDSFGLQVNYNGQGALNLFDLRINANNNGRRLAVLSLIAVFGLIDLVLLYRMLPRRWQNRMLALLAVALISSLPLFFYGLSDLEEPDLAFHLMRISGISQGLRDGQFPVRINTAWISGYGYPASIFYGDILLYFPAVLNLIGLSLYQSYKVFVFAVNLCTAGIAMFCFGRMFRNRIIGALTSLIYTTASYRMVDVFVRCAVGEYCAIMFFPLIALALWNIYTRANDSLKENMKNGIILAVGMSGIVTAHILSAEMIALAILIVFLFLYRKSFTWKTIRTFMIGVCGTLALSAFFLVPFADYFLHVPVRITSSVGAQTKLIQTIGASWADYFAFFNNPFGEFSQMLCSPGPVLMLVLMAAIYLWIRGRASRTVKMLCTVSLMMLWLGSRTFPWNFLAIHFRIFNFLAQVQFPWRYSAIAILFLSVLLGVLLKEKSLEDLFHLDGRRLVQLMSAAAIVMTCLFASYYQDNVSPSAPTDTANLHPFRTLINKEYMRTKTENDEIYMTDLNLYSGQFGRGSADYLEVISRKGTSIDLFVQNGDEEAEIIAPLIHYRGYEVYDDSGNQYEVHDSDNLLVSFVLPAGFEGDLHIRFRSPWTWSLSIAVSAASAILMAGYLMSCRKNRAEHPSSASRILH